MGVLEFVYKYSEKIGRKYPGPETIKAAKLLYPEEKPEAIIRSWDTSDLKKIMGIILGGSLLTVVAAIKNGSVKTVALTVFLTLIVACGIPALRIQNRKKELENRRQELELAFSELTSKLSVLLGAGLSVKNAWEKIVNDYKEDREKGLRDRHVLYEEMNLSLRLMSQGRTEREAYQYFGERTGLPPYLRLSSLLESSRRNGSFELGRTLGLEAREAFELRLNAAKQKGEKLGSKMLFPMMILFVLVLLILMVPAFLSW